MNPGSAAHKGGLLPNDVIKFANNIPCDILLNKFDELEEGRGVIQFIQALPISCVIEVMRENKPIKFMQRYVKENGQRILQNVQVAEFWCEVRREVNYFPQKKEKEKKTTR